MNWIKIDTTKKESTPPFNKQLLVGVFDNGMWYYTVAKLDSITIDIDGESWDWDYDCELDSQPTHFCFIEEPKQS